VIAANRALLLMLVATNFFGQNTAAIAATEAEYVGMWAQDAAAMYGYAGASSAASALSPFTAPLQATNPAGLGRQATTVTQAAGTSAGTGVQTVSPLTSAATPSALESLASTATSSTSTSPLSSLTTLTSGTSVVSGAVSSASMSTSGVSMLGSAGSLMNSFGSATSVFGQSFQMSGSVLSPAVGSGASALSASGTGGTAVTAAAGRAASLGALSIPQGWTSAAPAFSQVASALPAASGPGAMPPVAPGGQGAPFGPPLAKMAGRQGSSAPVPARYYFRPAVVQRPVYTG
jgi:PPE-repeat protein